MGRLSNPRHEQFCHYVADGTPKYKAYMQAGFNPGTPKNATNLSARLWRSRGSVSVSVRNRTFELMDIKRKAANLAREDILEMMLDQYHAADAAGQHAVSVKANELLGREIHHMFTPRNENINLQIKAESLEQLEQMAHEKFGDKAPKLIEFIKTLDQ